MALGRALVSDGGLHPRTGERDWRDLVVLACDLAAWPLALSAAALFHEKSPFAGAAITIALLGVVLQLGVGVATGLYRQHYPRLSFEETGAAAVTVFIVGVVLIVVEHLTINAGRSGLSLVLAMSAAMMLMFGHRYLRRLRVRLLTGAALSRREPVLILGAGGGGERAVRAMQSVASSPYRPVALIDDDPRRRKVRFGGLKVEGTSSDLERVAARHGATSVLVAIPSASRERLMELHRLVKSTGLQTLVMPPVQRLVGRGSPREITRYRDEDVLSRNVVDIDVAAVRDLISGSRVLVTGGGGSIGSELVRQLAELSPEELVVLDRDDSLLHAVMRSIPTECRDACVPVLADVRDVSRLDEVFERYRPEVVYHAAALKHVPALESAPQEAWKTNVLGTANLISACEAAGVSNLVNISTDKAANPRNVLGVTKRITERLTAAAAVRTGRPYVSVRFGNVIGSRGSVIETFEEQINAGGPVTVTHPEVTRYFMAVREAVRLTMQASAIGRPGEALVLDMGTPVKVLDVARQLIEQSDAEDEVEVEFTGLRPGEKMHEELLGDGEVANRPFHAMIDHVEVPGIELVDAIHACAAADVAPTSIDGLHLVAAYDASSFLSREAS